MTYRTLSSILLLISLACCLTSCLQPSVAATPEEAARLGAAGDLQTQLQNTNRFKVLGTRVLSNGQRIVVWIKWEDRYGRGLEEIYGYSVVQARGNGWELVTDNPLSNIDDLSSDNQQLIGDVETIGRTPHDPVMVIGIIREPQLVDAVDATFTNGQSFHDDGADNIFVFYMPSGHRVCNLRALDAQGNVLYERGSGMAGCAP
jgi:hypothetical protein